MPRNYEPINDKKYLDANGVTHYTRFVNEALSAVVDGVQDALAEKVDIDTYTNEFQGQGYGVCTTAESTTAKIVTLADYVPMDGGVIAVKFTYGVPANATMSVNEYDAKPIYFKGDAIESGVILAGDIATFMDDGDRYRLLAIDRMSVIESITDEEIDTLFE